MKKFLFACVGVGLAFSAGYLLYGARTWYNKKEDEDCHEGVSGSLNLSI